MQQYDIIQHIDKLECRITTIPPGGIAAMIESDKDHYH